MDWCTVRQAQELQNEGHPCNNLLEQIADGSITSQVYSPEEAHALMASLNRHTNKEL